MSIRPKTKQITSPESNTQEKRLLWFKVLQLCEGLNCLICQDGVHRWIPFYLLLWQCHVAQVHDLVAFKRVKVKYGGLAPTLVALSESHSLVVFPMVEYLSYKVLCRTLCKMAWYFITFPIFSVLYPCILKYPGRVTISGLPEVSLNETAFENSFVVCGLLLVIMEARLGPQ